MSGVLCKNILLADLLLGQYSLEILQSSLTDKNNENEVKSGCFEKLLRWRAPIFFPKWRKDIKSLVSKYWYFDK